MRRVIALLAVVISCTDRGPVTPEPVPLTPLTLATERSLWTGQGITDYDFDYQRVCECVPTQTFRISVRNGLVTLSYATNGQDIALANPPTIDSLFARAQRDLDGGQYQLKAAFDPVYHFPTTLSGDIPSIVDDEYWITVSNFVRK